ncbi:MAG TPA: RDD family protein [Oleiagrimonas sp.]|nr:RDD family protein [Oleiagrimonas sp.]
MEEENFEYVGFWLRLGAWLIDSLIFWIVATPVLASVYGWRYFTDPDYPAVVGPTDIAVNWVFPAVATVVLWMIWQATPGKMAISARVVDARTGMPARTIQYVVRYLAYLLSALPFCLGFIWVGVDSRKRGWHDMLAGTVVVRPRDRRPEAVNFDRR